MRQFGESPAVPSRERPGAYAIIVDASWRVAVVTIAGVAHLPGGGIEGDETPEQALHREVLEETGMTVEILHALGIACQYVSTPDGPMNKVGHHFVCHRTGTPGSGEADHTLHWWRSNRALETLVHDSARFMVRRALASC